MTDRSPCELCGNTESSFSDTLEGYYCLSCYAAKQAAEEAVFFPEEELPTFGKRRSPSGELIALDTAQLLQTDPEPLQWLAEGVWARSHLTMVGGREKSGKSLVQLALAAVMAKGGGTVAGINVQAGKVLIIDAENGRREIHRRLRAMGLEPEHADRLVIVEARGVDLFKDLNRLRGLIAEHQPDLVILDSFRSLWRGDERDEAACAAALYPLADLAHDGPAISLTHHAKKDGTEYRGSSAIGGCPDIILLLSRVAEDEDKARRKLAMPMCRVDEERPDVWLQIRRGVLGVELREAAPFQAPRPRDEKAEAVLDALTDEPQSEREIATASDVRRSTCQRVLRDLRTAGKADKLPGGWVAHWPTPYKGDGPPGPPPEKPVDMGDSGGPHDLGHLGHLGQQEDLDAELERFQAKLEDDS